MKALKKIAAIIIVFSILITGPILCTETRAYALNGSHIAYTLYFTPHSGFTSTSRLHFNNAMYLWNYWSGQNLLQLINSYSTHSTTNYPSNDGNSYIYRLNVGNTNYVAETTRAYVGSITTSADININVGHKWANSAQPDRYDVWSVFLHETGHVAGLSDIYSTSTPVMYYKASKNATKRDLTSDDKNGIAAIYGGVSATTNHTNDSFSELYLSKDKETLVKSGFLRPYSFDELVAGSSLIVKAKLTAISDAFQILPVFGDSPSNFTDYEFTVSSSIFGNAREGEKLTIRMEGGTAGGTTLIVEDNPEFKEGEEVLLFLYQPNMGSGYNTLGDYYYLLGLGQGVYYADLEDADHYTDLYGNKLSLQELKHITGKMNPDDIDADRFYKEFVENQKGNLKSGFITEEEYQTLMQEAEQYATIIS